MGYLSRKQIDAIGFASVGHDVMISKLASFHHAAAITIGNHVRIDDFCVFSAGLGGITIGNFVHISVGAALIGAKKITLDDFSGLSSHVSIYSSSDDYSGALMTNPMVPLPFRGGDHEEVFLGKHVIVGAGSVILPGTIIDDGVAIGALSLVSAHCEPFGIYAGTPARRIKERSRELLTLEDRLLSDHQGVGYSKNTSTEKNF
jgi:acetyltransferase-like isoleucine patch superfamily enzyme